MSTIYHCPSVDRLWRNMNLIFQSLKNRFCEIYFVCPLDCVIKVLFQIFSERLSSKIPQYFENLDPPFICYKYNNLLEEKSRKYQGVFKVKSPVKTWQVRGIWSQRLEHKQVPKRGTEPGVRKGKRSLLASHTRCKCSMETTHKSVKVKLGIKVMKLVESLINFFFFNYKLVTSDLKFHSVFMFLCELSVSNSPVRARGVKSRMCTSVSPAWS